MSFGKSEFTLRTELADVQAKMAATKDEMDRLNALLQVFEDFADWEAFRAGYLEGVRLRQIERACATRIGDAEDVRSRLSGQRDEIMFLIRAKDDLRRDLDALKGNFLMFGEMAAKITKKIERASHVR